jgi:acyl carrier protein
MDERIRAVLADHGRLAVDAGQLRPGDDLSQAGLTSHAAVNVMLALEDEFDVEFPERLLRKQTFTSIDSIRGAISELVSAGVEG